MKVRIKQTIFALSLAAIGLLLSAALALSTLFGPKRAVAEPEQSAEAYYYSELRSNKLAQRFYHVFEDMDKNGYFVDGTREYDLASVLTQAELGDYITNNSPAIPVALGAARDAYYLDHPELFYASVHNLRITFGSDGSVHQAYLGAGKAANYYEDNTVSSAAEVEAAVKDFDAQVEKAVAAAKKNNADVVQQIRNVNEYLCDIAEYDYGAYDDMQSGVRYNGYVNTAYGILNGKAGKAMCGGYSTAFKVIMDKLGIPCVLVSGAACPSNVESAGFEPHMWNAVRVDGHWYGVDVTWNDTENNRDKYTLVGDDFLMRNRYEDPVISSSEFKVKYPVLRALDYGDNKDNSGFEFKDSGEADGIEFGYDSGRVGVSYEDKNANQLKEEGKYLAVRTKEGEAWIDYNAINQLIFDQYDWDLIVGKYSTYIPDATAEFLQFAIIDIAPDCDTPYGGITLTNAGWSNLTAEHIISESVKYRNQGHGTVADKPHVKSMTPNETGYIMSLDPLNISLTFSEQLKYEDAVSTEVGIEVTATRNDVKDYIKVENVVWNAETNTVTFRFTPSQQYSHNCVTYGFAPTNLIGETSGEKPEPGKLAFKLKQVVCSKVYNDGRLYMKVFGEPQFVSASDESINQFKDKDGKPVVGNQRSQLMLVVNEPSAAESKQMADAAQAQIGDTVKASSTYQINLQMCGVVQQVPKGSYMQVGFGFPEGYKYNPSDKGTTFTVYHYTRKADGTIDTVEAVPCVITERGIIATVKSFSPFMICAVTSDSPSVRNLDKRVLASVDSEGGNIDNKDIMSVASGTTLTYKITAEAGYSIDRVLVNGEDKKASVTADGKLALKESDLEANNTVVVSFISDRAAKFIVDNKITVVEPVIVVTESDMIVAQEGVFGGEIGPGENMGGSAGAPKDPKKGNLGLILGIVIPLVVILIAGGATAFILIRKKRAVAPASANKAQSTKQNNAAANVQRPTTTNTQRPTTTNTQRPAPTNTQRPAPTNTQRPTTTNAQRPAPTNTQRPTPTSTQRPAPTSTQRPTPTNTQRPTPTNTQRPAPTSTQRPTPTRKPTDKK